MRLPLIILALAAPLALGACDQARSFAEMTVHRAADHWCLNVPLEMREQARNTLGTTADGNTIRVGCAADVAD